MRARLDRKNNGIDANMLSEVEVGFSRYFNKSLWEEDAE